MIKFNMLNTVNGIQYNVTSEITLMLFFSREHCINDQIKNIATCSNKHSAVIICIVANYNTLLL